MESLRRLGRYNLWANARVWRVVGEADPALLDDAAGGTIGTISATLKHLVFVEDRFLAAVRGHDPAAELGPRDVYLARPLSWFAERMQAVGEGYQTVLAERDEAFLETTLPGLRWDFLTVRDGLLQALTHSTHHRAEVLSALGTHGLVVPDVDFIVMLAEQHSPEADRPR